MIRDNDPLLQRISALINPDHKNMRLSCAALLVCSAAALVPSTGLARAVRVPLHSPPLRACATAASEPTKPRRFRRWAGALSAAFLGTVAPGGAALAVAAAPIGGVTRTGRLLYRVQQTLVASAPIAVVVFSILCIFLGGVLLKVVSGGPVTETSYRAYTLLNNVPGADATLEGEPFVSRAVANALYLIGVLTFAILIGVVRRARARAPHAACDRCV